MKQKDKQVLDSKIELETMQKEILQGFFILKIIMLR